MRVATCLFFGVAMLISLGQGEIFHGVAVPPGGTNAWVVTIETTAVYRTTDFGYNWQPQEINTFRDFFDVFFLDDSNGWTCGRVGDIWHTRNGGLSWERQNLGGPKFATRIRFLDEEYGWSAGGEAILLHTTNGGEEWHMTFFPRPPYPSDTVDFQGVFFIDRRTGWLVAGRFPEGGDTFAYGQGFITKTQDGCSTWTLQRVDTVYDFYDVAFIDANHGWVVGGNDRTMNGVVLHTTDGGNSWMEQALPSGTRFLRAVTFNGDKGWACGRNGTIIHTSNRGATWVRQTTGVDTTLFDIEFADSLRGMAAGNSVVLVTTDGGQSWIRRLGGIDDVARRQQETPSLRVTPSVAFGGFVTVRMVKAGRLCSAVQVLDAAGRIAGTETWRSQDGEDGLEIDISHLPAGVYLVRLVGAGTETAVFVRTGR